MSDRPFDLVVFGATGFTGRLAAHWLAEHAPGGLRWTLAARRAPALKAIAEEVGLDDEGIVADSTDRDSIDAMVRQTRCVLSMAGPFADYSDPVVAACVEHDTHYVDITGEAPWVRDLIEQHHERAREQGTRIVPMAGFDSVPSDLGTWFCVQQVRERFHDPTRSVTATFALRGGGLNGGTLASALRLAERYPAKDLADPFLLTPGRTSREQWTAHADPRGPVFDTHRQRWTMPHVMGSINSRVVRRSAWLFQEADAPYGPDFHYHEYADVGGGRRWRASLLTLGLGLGFKMLRSRTGRRVAARLGPDPGEGPSEQAMQEGSFRVTYRAESVGGRALTAKMESPGDAGNVSTVRFACCAAMTLLFDAEEIGLGPGTGGVLTPAFALGEAYLTRLRSHGVSLEVTEVAS